MYTYKIWDGKEAVNGVSPAAVREAHKLAAEDLVGLVVDEAGRVQILQYFKGTKMTVAGMTKWLMEETERLNNPPETEA